MSELILYYNFLKTILYEKMILFANKTHDRVSMSIIGFFDLENSLY